MTVQPTKPVIADVCVRPLVVDLDYTLVRTDTLIESVLGLFTKHPLDFLAVLAGLRHGRAGFKQRVAGRIALNYATLPYNQDIIEYIKERRASGGQVFLATAADQAIANGVAEHLGLFDGVIGSDGSHNLKGAEKAASIVQCIGEDFDYIGDSTADLPVWVKASQILVAGNSSAVQRELKGQNLVPAKQFSALRASPRDWVKSLRLHQWSKNLLLFVPMFLAHDFLYLPYIIATILGFLAFGFVASATYLLNDMNDLAADRGHFGKRHRALASGRISIPLALVVALIMLTTGMGGAFLINPNFGVVLLAYLAVTVTYSIWLKAQPLIDVMVIGGLFTIRIFAGIALTEQSSSLWLISFAMIIFASLALAKRHAKLIRAAADGRTVVGRGYLVTDTPLTVSLGLSTASFSIVLMLLYMHFDAEKTGLYTHTEYLFIMPLVLASWLIRIWVKAHRGELHDDPVVFAIRDRVSIIHGLMVGLLWVFAIS